jgi:hypothetical protein
MTTHGEWDEWTYGIHMKGWNLECGKLKADIQQTSPGAPYYLSINLHPLASGTDLEALKHAAEAHIAERIRAVLPAYRLIRLRMRKRSKADQRGPNGSSMGTRAR